MRRQGSGARGAGRKKTGGSEVALAASRFSLQSVKVVGFRSWKERQTILFAESGLTCITGPNGSGKSTLLNAILFGLGENASQIGARQTSELASGADAEAELLFRSASPGVSDVKVSSAVSRATGQRTYAFNGQKLPKHRFEHFLRTRLGISTGNPFWRVSQDGIHRLLHASPHDLHDALCEASGTKAINTHRSNAIRQLGRWRKSLAEVQANIAVLEQAVGREGAHLLAMDRVRELTAELDAIPGEMEALDREIATAEQRAAEQLVARLISDVKTLETEKSAADDRLHALEVEITELGVEGGAGCGGGGVDGGAYGCGGSETLQKELSRVLTELAKISTEVKLERASLREREELSLKWAEILRAAKADRLDIASKSVALRGRCSMLKERRACLEQEVDRSRAQLSCSLTSSGSGGDGKDGALRAARRALDDHEESIKRAESRSQALSAAASQAETEVQARKSEAEAANASLDEVWERMRQVGSPLHTAEDADKYLRGVQEQRRVQRERQLDLSRTLESSRQSLAAAARRLGAPYWCSRLRGGGGDDGHRGFLFELFELRQREPREDGATYFQALSSLLAGSLTAWVCDSSRHANQALDLAKSNAAGLRVWPIDRLKASASARRGQGRSGRIRQALEWAERHWPGQAKVIDPASLLRWDERDSGVTIAMEKALGAWVITDDDDTSAMVLSELRMSSITVSGVRHAPGEVVGGEAHGEKARLAAKQDWDLANRARRQEEASLEACVEGCRDLTRRLEAGAELSRLQGRRAVLKKEVHECAGRLAESERIAAGMRQKLGWANSERDRLEKQSQSMGHGGGGNTADPAEVVSAMKRALASRERDLRTAENACAQMEKEIGTLAEASMQALERENNAREALGMNEEDNIVENGPEDVDDDGRMEEERVERRERNGRRGGWGGGGSSDGGADAACGVDGEDEEAKEAAAVEAAIRNRLAGMKRALEIKISRVTELERDRDKLTARVEKANAKERVAGQRASALEEEMADAKTVATETGARLKAKRKRVKEAERCVRETIARLEERGCADGRGPSGGCGEFERREILLSTVGDGVRSAREGGEWETSAAGAEGAVMVESRDWDGEECERGSTGAAPESGKENVPTQPSSEELLSKKHELAAKEKLLSSELRHLRRQSDSKQQQQQQHRRGGNGTGGAGGRGSTGRARRGASQAAAGAAVMAGSVDEVTVQRRRAKVGVLKQHLASVLEGARQLEAGVVACEGRMREANEACYASVRTELRTLFGALCRNKSADLVMTGRKLEDGLRLVVRNESTQAATTTVDSPPQTMAAAVERAPQELSGGQQALLGLALVLALSSYQAPPLCLLDEVDAALDETNQAAAARLVALKFRHGQALCVSHHADFHRQSGHCIAVEMRNGVSRVQA
ncbi:unnamed protein product [Scytosiphon promiscuus]